MDTAKSQPAIPERLKRDKSPRWMQHSRPMTHETRNTILPLIGIVTLAIKFRALQKPIETKIAIDDYS
ncbi:MAG: hypothetical protein DME50_16350 [Verrucomicrobia bacterium]|nr:MAG: hypothetical protein DME50_16350 [Verrucomicrobiota bacterium]